MGSKEGQHMTVADLKPAAYNPRKIKEWELEALMGSPVNFKIIGNIVYAEPAEFMDISNADADALHEVVKTNISGNFSLIDVRPSTTSIDPMVYRYAKELMPQFTAYALVAE